jgi:hypothetical protein
MRFQFRCRLVFSFLHEHGFKIGFDLGTKENEVKEIILFS